MNMHEQSSPSHVNLRFADINVVARGKMGSLGLHVGAYNDGAVGIRVYNELIKSQHEFYLSGEQAFRTAQPANMGRHAFFLRKEALSFKVLRYQESNKEDETSGDIGLATDGRVFIRVHVAPYAPGDDGKLCTVDLFTGELVDSPKSNEVVWARLWEIHLDTPDGSTSVIAARRSTSSAL